MLDVKLLPRMEVAKMLGRSRSGFEALVNSGRGPRLTRIGGNVFVREDDLAEWLEACREPARPACVGRKTRSDAGSTRSGASATN
jgi:predicted DNA-binding transcriptional regulator AlpA